MALRLVVLATVSAMVLMGQVQLPVQDLRKQLHGRTDAAAMSEWVNVLTDMHLSKDPELRSVVRSLRTLRLYDNEPWIQAVNTGYAYLGDSEGARDFRSELARGRPDSTWGIQAAIERWESTHPPRKTTEQGFKDGTIARLEVVKKLHGERPDSEAAMQEYVRAALPLESYLRTGEALALADLLLHAKRPFLNGRSRFAIVDIYLHHHVRLDQIPSMIEEELQELQTQFRQQQSLGTGVEFANLRLISGQFQGHSDLADYWLQQGDGERARAFAERARADLARLGQPPSTQRSFFEAQQKEFLLLAKRVGLNVQSPTGTKAVDWANVGRRSLGDFETRDLAGRTWSKHDWSGKVVLINMWASWCGPCRADLPFIQGLYEKFHGRSDVLIISINVDSNPDLARRIVREQHYSFPVINSQRLADLVDFQNGVPQNRIVDRLGQLLIEPIQGSGEMLVTQATELVNQFK